MEILDWISGALGLDRQVQDLGVWQMVLRALAVYVIALFVVKAAKRRFMGKNSVFDFVMAIILGSVMSRAINGTAPFGPTLAASIALVAAHRVVSWVSSRWAAFGGFVQGRPVVLARKGQIDWKQMRAHDFTEQDLRSALRRLKHDEHLTLGESVVLEPNGELSIVGK